MLKLGNSEALTLDMGESTFILDAIEWLDTMLDSLGLMFELCITALDDGTTLELIITLELDMTEDGIRLELISKVELVTTGVETRLKLISALGLVIMDVGTIIVLVLTLTITEEYSMLETTVGVNEKLVIVNLELLSFIEK